MARMAGVVVPNYPHHAIDDRRYFSVKMTSATILIACLSSQENQALTDADKSNDKDLIDL
jgi:hypothetical protein